MSIHKPAFRTAAPWALVLLVLAAADLGAQTGYRLTSQSIEVDRSAHWQAWSVPEGLVTISAAGAVQPVRLPPSINASLDAGNFTYELPAALSSFYRNSAVDSGVLQVTGGIKRARSNEATAARIMDGDVTTYWEPDPSDELADWQVEIDLGRLVSATHVTIRFAEDDPDDRADPFHQFRVHTATGQNPFDDSTNPTLEYELAGGTTAPNVDQREFTFALEPALVHTEEWTGRLVQYVRVVATSRRQDRAEQVSASEYEALPADDRGAVDNIWLIGGEERVVTDERYASLPSEQQGGQRYYRHERPRLAEVEVWTAGNNVAHGIVGRNGTLEEGNPNAAPDLAFDGSIRTNWNATVYSTVGDIAGWGLLRIDLGALLRIGAVRTITRRAQRAESTIYGYQLRGSDGSLAPDGSLIWEILSDDGRLLNSDQTRLFEDRFESRPLRYLEFKNVDTARRTLAHLGNRYQSVVTEMQIFGEGAVPEVRMVSDLIDMGSSRLTSTVSWEADTPEGTSVEIRTRSGDDLREVTHYFLLTGEEVSKAEWDSKPSFFRGPVETETIPGPGWSNFSQAYLTPGAKILSPSPRRYLIVEARLLSDDPDTTATLHSISIATRRPIAGRLLAEITPQQNVPVGELVDFDLYLRPSFTATPGGGFDRLRLTAPSRSAMQLLAVDLGDSTDFVAGTTRRFEGVAGDSLLRDSGGAVIRVAGAASDTLVLDLPETIRASGPDFVRLSFASTVFQSGSTFRLEAATSSQPDAWQEADGGDVVGDDLSTGRGLTVLTPLTGRNIRVGEATSRAFSPNGDGINDEAVIEFAVLRVNIDRAVGVDVHDLTGRKIRSIRETRSLANGLYRLGWDGRDDEGGLVPPGVYVLRFQVDADAEVSQPTRLISVVY